MSSAIVRAAKEYFQENQVELFVYSPSASSSERAKEELPQATICQSAQELYAVADMILFGAKPQVLPQILTKDRTHLASKAVVSIAAGLSSEALQGLLEEDSRLQRIMPNLGLMAGKGMTLISQASTLREEEKSFLIGLFASAGKVKILPEKLMDIGSVLSGSSGAFYTMFLEALAEAGLRHGLSYQDAQELVLQNHLGTILQLQEGLSSEQLRKETCSPAGTTIEGVTALEREGLRAAVHAAVEASYLRCLELSK